MRFWMRQLAKQKSNKGFTLVELIVVLTILGIMAAILVPQLLGYVDQAKLEAEYVAGESCRMAIQMQLDALQFQEMAPNFEHRNLQTTGETCALWSGGWRSNVIDMSGQEITYLYFGIGEYKYYSENGMDMNPPYTVYIIGYQRTEDSPVVFYDGTKWSQNCPWKGYSTNGKKMIQVGNQTICMQFFSIRYGKDPKPEIFFSKCMSEY